MRVWKSIHPRDRRALAIGSIVLGSALGMSFVVRPLLHARAALQERLRDQRGLLARELELVAAAERPVDRDAASAALVAVEDRLFPDRDPLAATAALVKVVGEAARGQGVLLESIEAGAPEAVGGTLLAVRVDVRGRGDIEGLLRWLTVLEGSKQLLRVEQLGVARVGGGRYQGSTELEVLSLAATVRGFVFAGTDGEGIATIPVGGEHRQ